jgi:hypothetical protein
MPYVSAKYLPLDPMMPEGAPRQVQAIDTQGLVWAMNEDSLVGDWLEYIANGGAIEPADPVPETQPGPETEPEA